MYDKLSFDLIRSKLVRKAEILFGNFVELDTWEQGKAATKQCFSYRRNPDCLAQELTRVTPSKNEYITYYGTRLQLLRRQVAQRISKDINMTETGK